MSSTIPTVPSGSSGTGSADDTPAVFRAFNAPGRPSVAVSANQRVTVPARPSADIERLADRVRAAPGRVNGARAVSEMGSPNGA